MCTLKITIITTYEVIKRRKLVIDYRKQIDS